MSPQHQHQVVEPRKLGKEKQISYRSTQDIILGLDLAAAKLATVEQFDGGKLRTGHLVNAVALWLNTLSMDQLKEFAGPKLRLLERHLEGGVDVGGAAPRRVAAQGEDVAAGAKRRRA